MARTLIVDDEQHCLEELQHLLKPYRDSVEIVGYAKSVEEGVLLIHEKRPDLVFLDVQIGKQTGFDLLQQVPSSTFDVIFTTAYDKYAVDAFKFSALDYLLKPIEPNELKRSLEKHQRHASTKYLERKMDVLMHNLSNMNGVKKITVPTLEGYEFLETSEIVRCQSDANYTEIFLGSGKKLMVSRTLKSFEELLGDEHFFRVHYSHLINLKKVRKYIKGKGGHVVMKDNTSIEVSTRRKEEFLNQLKGMVS